MTARVRSNEDIQDLHKCVLSLYLRSGDAISIDEITNALEWSEDRVRDALWRCPLISEHGKYYPSPLYMRQIILLMQGALTGAGAKHVVEELGL